MATKKDDKKKKDNRALITEDGTFTAFGVAPTVTTVNESKKPVKK